MERRSSRKPRIAYNQETIITQRTVRKQRTRKSSSSESATDSNKTNGTPPKQAKFTKNTESKYNPTVLMKELSLNGLPTSDESIKIDSTKKFQSAKKTLNSSGTNDLPGREKELKQLTEYFNNNLTNRTSSSMYISGAPGTGKTACLSKLINGFEFTDKFHKIYVNCTGISSIGSIYKKICLEFKLKISTEKENLTNIENYFKKSRKMILMVLDEIDQLVGSKQTVLYTIFEWPAKHKSKILLIGIANSLDLTDRMLSRLNAKCEMKPHLMHFAPYTKDQIVDIFKKRLEQVNVLELFPAVTIQLLAAKVASVSGDVRRALDIGRRVIELAEKNKKELKNIDISDLGIEELDKPIEKVEIKQVMTVLNNVYGNSQKLNNDLDETFPLQQKILLCTLLLMLKHSKNKDITIGRLHTVYTKLCTTRKIPAVDQSEFVSLCSLIETQGILRIIPKKEPRLHKVQMQWDEMEVTTVLKDKQLIASILADTSCL